MPLTSREVQDAYGLNGSLKATKAMILEHGADAVAAWRDGAGQTVLHYGVRCYDSDALRALIRAGVDVAAADDCEATALHWAETAEAVRVLTAATSNMALLSARTLYGLTPLHWACSSGHVEVAKAMLAVSDCIPRVVLAKDNDGRTARDLASHYHTELLPVLDKAMGEAEVWSRRSSVLLIGLAAADFVKAVAVAAGKRWAL